jgi:hypothetical protein
MTQAHHVGRQTRPSSGSLPHKPRLQEATPSEGGSCVPSRCVAKPDAQSIACRSSIVPATECDNSHG